MTYNDFDSLVPGDMIAWSRSGQTTYVVAILISTTIVDNDDVMITFLVISDKGSHGLKTNRYVRRARASVIARPGAMSMQR